MLPMFLLTAKLQSEEYFNLKMFIDTNLYFMNNKFGDKADCQH